MYLICLKFWAYKIFNWWKIFLKYDDNLNYYASFVIFQTYKNVILRSVHSLGLVPLIMFLPICHGLNNLLCTYSKFCCCWLQLWKCYNNYFLVNFIHLDLLKFFNFGFFDLFFFFIFSFSQLHEIISTHVKVLGGTL